MLVPKVSYNKYICRKGGWLLGIGIKNRNAHLTIFVLTPGTLLCLDKKVGMKSEGERGWYVSKEHRLELPGSFKAEGWQMPFPATWAYSVLSGRLRDVESLTSGRAASGWAARPWLSSAAPSWGSSHGWGAPPAPARSGWPPGTRCLPCSRTAGPWTSRTWPPPEPSWVK